MAIHPLTEFEKKVYNEVKKIPRGKISTYCAIAQKIGNPRAARAVGNALKRNPFKNIPCHRVVRNDGRIGGFARGTRAKTEKLEQEGLVVKNGHVDFSRYDV